MARKAVSWILEFASNLPKKEMIKCLRENELAVKTVLQYAYDPNIKWLLPKGDVPYEPCKFDNQDGILYAELRRLYLFVEGGNPNLTQLKRESIFIDIIENVTPEDAILLVNIKDKKLPHPKVTSKIVLEAFPGLY